MSGLPSSSTAQAGPSTPRGPPKQRTTFEPHSDIEPFYTGSGPTAITADGRYLFTALNEEVVVTDLDVSVGQVVHRLKPDGEEVSSISITPSTSHLCVTTRSASSTLFIYAFVSFAPFQLKRLRVQAKAHDAPVPISTIDQTGTLLATGSADGIVKVWDIQGGFVTHALRGHGGIVSAIAFDIVVSGQQRSRSNLVTASVDGRVRVWDLNDRPKQGVQKPVATLGGHVSVVRGLSVSRDGNRIVSGARDKTICLWQLSTSENGKKKKGLSNGHTAQWALKETISAAEGIEACGFLEDSDDLFYTGGTSSELRIWSFDSGSTQSLQPKGKWAQSSYNGEASEQLTEEPDEEEDVLKGIVGVHQLSKSAAGQAALISLHADSRLVFRRLGTDGSEAPLSRLRQLIGFNDESVDLAILGNTGRFAVATNSSSIQVYPLPQIAASAAKSDDLSTVKGDSTVVEASSVHLLPSEPSEPGHSDNVLCIDSSPLGDLLVSGSKDRSARVWAFFPGEGEWRCIAVAQGHAESVGAVCFSKKARAVDGIGANFLVTASQDRTIKVWDLSTLEVPSSTSTTSSSPVRLRSLLTLKVHEKAINSVGVAPNDSLLATGSQDRTARLFSLSYTPPSKTNSSIASAKLSPLTTLRGHKRGVWSVVFSPFDAALLTTSGDRSAKLWSLRDFTCVKTFEGHSHTVLSATFLDGSRGSQMISCGADGLIKNWAVRDEECLGTLEGSEDRLWSIKSFESGQGLVSTGSDGTIRFWRDVTKEKEETKQKEREEAVAREQRFENLLQAEDYKEAILLCLLEGQPKRLLGLLTSVASKRPIIVGAATNDRAKPTDAMDLLINSALSNTPIAALSSLASTPEQDSLSLTGLHSVDVALSTLPATHVRTLLSYVKVWNTTSRTSTIAQNVLNLILRSYDVEEVLRIFEPSNSLSSAPTGPKSPFTSANRASVIGAASLPDLVESLIPYSERHYARQERIILESAVLDYTLRCMGVQGGADGDLESEREEEEDTDNDVMTDEEQSQSNSDEEESEDEDSMEAD